MTLIADTFRKTCYVLWESGNGIDMTLPNGDKVTETTATYDICHLFGATVHQATPCGIDVIEFADGSFAICGQNGASILDTGYRPDHEHPLSDTAAPKPTESLAA